MIVKNIEKFSILLNATRARKKEIRERILTRHTHSPHS